VPKNTAIPVMKLNKSIVFILNVLVFNLLVLDLLPSPMDKLQSELDTYKKDFYDLMEKNLGIFKD